MDLSETIKDARVKMIGDALGDGSLLKMYDSDTTLLAELPLVHPSYSDVTNGVMTMEPTGDTLVLVTGEVAKATLVDHNGDAVGDLTVGVNDSGADLEFPSDNLYVYQGALLELTDWTIE